MDLWFPDTSRRRFSLPGMDPGGSLFILILLCLLLNAFSDSVIRSQLGRPIPGVRTDGGVPGHGGPFCAAWKFAVETNDAGPWKTVPRPCVRFVERYMKGVRYLSDSKAVAAYSLAFAKTVNVSGDGKDAWVFDIDETLLSNLDYYATRGFGGDTFNEASFNEWAKSGQATALPASLELYKKLELLGFTIFLLTGRDEPLRNITVKNLHSVGYTGWRKLILRGSPAQGKKAVVYKSEKRKELEELGYRIRGSSGDQWSDLFGFSTAQRSFKLPNPMYYIA